MSDPETHVGAPVRQPPGRVIVVTGPPGAGKTTVARLLADEMTPSVHLHGDDFWSYIRRGHIPPYLAASRHQNQIVIGVIAQAAFGYAQGGYHVICDGIIGPWFVDEFRAAATGHTPPLHYVIVRPDLTATLRRATERGGDALTDSGPIRSLHRQFTDAGAYEAHVLDSTRLTPLATTRAILTGLAEGSFLLPSPANATSSWAPDHEVRGRAEAPDAVRYPREFD